MDPITIAMLGTSALSSILGYSDQKKQQKQLQNTQNQQLQIAREQQQLAEEMARRGIATQIDANGNVTAYDQATNTWKTVLSPTQQAIQDLSDQETINQYQTDAPMNRIEAILNATRRSKEGVAANGALASFTDTLANPVRGSDLASQLRLDRTNAVNQGFDQVSSQLGTQALRSGAAGGGAIAAQLAKQRSQAIAQTMGSPEIEGMQLAQDVNNSRSGAAGNIYNILAGRASNAPIQTFNPSGVATGANSALAGARSNATGSLGNSANINANAANIIGNAPIVGGSGLSEMLSGLSNVIGAYKSAGGGTSKKKAAGNEWSDSWGGGS